MKYKAKIMTVLLMVAAFPLQGTACEAMGGHQGKSSHTCQAGEEQQCTSNDKSCDFSAKRCVSDHAHGQHHAIPGMSPEYMRKIVIKADLIALSEKQRKQVAELLIQAETDAAAVHARAEVVVAEFKSKLYSGGATDREIKVYATRMGELHSEKFQANLKASVAAAKLLSDEQKQMLHAHKQGHPQAHQNGHNKGHNKGSQQQ